MVALKFERADESEPLNDLVPPFARDILGHFDRRRIGEALAAMRPAGAVMVPATMRSFKSSGLSFARSLVARMLSERWTIERSHCQVAGDGTGLVVYRIDANGHRMTFAASCHGLDDVERTGRIKDNDLDFHAVLFDGDVPLERLHQEAEEQISKVWKGRTDNTALGWTFANRSLRSFEYTVQSLADGQQPDLATIAGGGAYLLRNAGFYGNGRHGTRSWLALPEDHPLSYPYHVDLFPLYLWREAGFDFVEGIARARSDKAVRLDTRVRRYLGIGNQSGIGMVAALVRWPHWLSGFVFAREFVLALALTETGPLADGRLARLVALMKRAERYYLESDTDIDPALEDRASISRELSTLRAMAEGFAEGPGRTAHLHPLGALMAHARAHCGIGTCEQLAALLIDIFPERISALLPTIPAAMGTRRDVRPEMSIAELRQLIASKYGWTLEFDLAAEGGRRYFWYRSEENGENRRGERDIDPGLDFETFVDVAGAVQALSGRLAAAPQQWSVGRYLVDHPDDVFIVARVQSLAELPYSEIQANIIHADFLPGDMIRFYLHILGMETTNPNNNRWVRGVFMQGAPLPEEVAAGAVGDWAFPVITTA